jgi:hypothetical protein
MKHIAIIHIILKPTTAMLAVRTTEEIISLTTMSRLKEVIIITVANVKYAHLTSSAVVPSMLENG